MYTLQEATIANGAAGIAPPASVIGEPLNDSEFAVVQRYCAQAFDEFHRMGLTIHIEHDFDAFARYRRSVGDRWCNPSFDPALCRIGPSDFWLRVDDDDGHTVASSAMRIFDAVDDFYYLMRSGALWCDRLLRVVDRCEVDCAIPTFGGAIAYWGGMWVDPSQRGRGLAKLVPALQRALTLRNKPFDFETGLVFEPLVALALRQYQFARVEVVLDDYFPPSGKPARVFLCHMSRAEALASVALAARDDQEPVSAVA